MLIHKITPSVVYSLWMRRLGTQLNEPTNQNSIKVPKVVKSKINNTLLSASSMNKGLTTHGKISCE